MVGEAAGVHVRVLYAWVLYAWVLYAWVLYAWVLYAWVSRRTRGCRGVRVGVEDAHVSVVGGVRTRMWGVEIRMSAEIK
jgi:hypothetical protein